MRTKSNLQSFLGTLAVATTLACGTDSTPVNDNEVCQEDCEQIETPAACDYASTEADCDRIAAACAPSGCGCRIQVQGRPPAVGDNALVLPAEIAATAHAQLYRLGGDEIGGAHPAWSLAPLPSDAAPAFRLDNEKITGVPVAGEVSVEARFGDLATCNQRLVNIGPTPPASVRLTVTSNAGYVVPNAVLIVDANSDGVGDVSALPSDVRGVASYVIPNTTYDLTVFAPGHRPLSLVGVSPDVQDIGITVELDRDQVAGVSGMLDYSTYVDEFLGGRTNSISLGLVSASFPIESLMEFDLGLLLGGRLDASDCSEAQAPNCYDIVVPNFFEARVFTWGGFVLSTHNMPLKPHFEVAAAPGPRVVWSIGGQWALDDVQDVFYDVMEGAQSFCQCNATDACDASCSCDLDCGPSMASRLLRSTQAVLADAAVAVQSNVVLNAVELAEWQAHITTPYDTREPDLRFPLHADGGDRSALTLSEPMSSTVRVEVPGLPEDPGYPGKSMEGILVLSGVLHRASGFVPLGIGAGFDCTADTCAGHRTGLTDFAYDGQIATGEVVTSRAGSPANLGDAAPRTVVMAWPVDSIRDQIHRATAVVYPEGEGAHLRAEPGDYPGFAALDDDRASRTYTFQSVPEADLQRVAFGGGWTIYAASNQASGRTFVAPVPPITIRDPWTASDVVVTHSALRLEGRPSFSRVLANDTLGLGNLGEHLTGFSTERR